MPIVLRSSLEHRIIEYASGRYPVTADEMARSLHVSGSRLLEELRRMERRGLVALDVLPDRIFVRLLVAVPFPPGRERKHGQGPLNERKKQTGGGDDPAYH